MLQIYALYHMCSMKQTGDGFDQNIRQVHTLFSNGLLIAPLNEELQKQGIAVQNVCITSSAVLFRVIAHALDAHVPHGM